jgi:hypothetical protein
MSTGRLTGCTPRIDGGRGHIQVSMEFTLKKNLPLKEVGPGRGIRSPDESLSLNNLTKPPKRLECSAQGIALWFKVVKFG